MENLPLEEIEKRAFETLKDADSLTLPIDPWKVAAYLGVEIHLQTFEDEVSGVLLINGGERHVMVNSSHHGNRQRFTIAHELGHLILHHDRGDRLFIDTHMQMYQRVGAPDSRAYLEPGSATTPQEERQANQFAAALLMPPDLLVKASHERDLFDELDVTALALQFCVSEQAMAIRLQQLYVINPVLTSSDSVTQIGSKGE
jgi:Zn-dependent peptidase ImmA (M78 family)